MSVASGAVVNMVGTVAAVCTTSALVPQLVRIFRLKTARDISLNMFVFFTVGVSLWLYYGLAIHSVPVIVANSVTLALSIAILVLKIRYDRPGRDGR